MISAKDELIFLSSALFNLLEIIRYNGLLSLEHDIANHETSEAFSTFTPDVRRVIIEFVDDMMRGTFDEKTAKHTRAGRKMKMGVFKDTWAVSFAENVLNNSLSGIPSLIAVETARLGLPDEIRPEYPEMEEYIRLNRSTRVETKDTFEERIDRLLNAFVSNDEEKRVSE